MGVVGGEIGGLRTFDGPVDFFFFLDWILLIWEVLARH